MQRLLFGLAIAGLTLMAPAWAHAGDQASAAKSADQQLADQVQEQPEQWPTPPFQHRRESGRRNLLASTARSAISSN